MIEVNNRVYHRRNDLYGVIERFSDDRAVAFVKYEWPWNPALPASPVPVEELSTLTNVV